MKRFWLNKGIVRVILSLMLVVSFMMFASSNALAATTATVTVTQQVAYIAISNSAATYTLNSDASSAHINYVQPNTTYYSNPGGVAGSGTAPSTTVVDGECEWTLTNSSTVAVDLTANMANFAGGSDNSTNGNGTAGATAYAAWTYWSGVALASKVVCNSSGSSTAYSNLAASGTKKWGLMFGTQTNAWTGSSSATSALTVTGAIH